MTGHVERDAVRRPRKEKRIKNKYLRIKKNVWMVHSAKQAN